MNNQKEDIHTPCPVCREKFSKCEHSYWYMKKVVAAALSRDLQFHKDVVKVAKGMNK